MKHTIFGILVFVHILSISLILSVNNGWGANFRKGIITHDVNLRKGPGTRYKRVRVLKKSSQVFINNDKTVRPWYFVTYRNQSGYVYSKYIAIKKNSKKSRILNSFRNLEGEWELPYLPISIIVNRNGISLSGKASLVTLIGKFSIGRTFKVIEKNKNKNTLLLVIRCKRKKDSIYKIKDAEEANILLDGKTHVKIRLNHVIIDVSDGAVREIFFRGKKGVNHSGYRYSRSGMWGTYIGPVKNYKPHGKGTFLYDNGDRYIGYYKYGKRHGKGTSYFKNGRIEYRLYRNGKRVK